jgi:hypothetical protein
MANPHQTMIWDQFDYRISDHYLSALFNGDESGIDQSDCKALQAFIDRANDTARAAGFIIGHWSMPGDDESDDDWGRCDVSGLLAMRRTVSLMVYRKQSGGV